MTAVVVPKPILPVVDVDAAADFYERLGFGVESYDDGYAWVSHGGVEIAHLRYVDGLDVAANAASVYFHVQDVDAWHAALVAAGVAVGDVADMPWAMREFSLTDPSGNLIRVGSNT